MKWVNFLGVYNHYFGCCAVVGKFDQAASVSNDTTRAHYLLPRELSMSFFRCLCINAADPPTPEVLEPLMREQRALRTFSQSLGGKRYTYDTATDEGEAAWEQHFGSEQWVRVRAAKRLCDPFHVLGCGVKMFDNSTTLTPTKIGFAISPKDDFDESDDDDPGDLDDSAPIPLDWNV